MFGVYFEAMLSRIEIGQNQIHERRVPTGTFLVVRWLGLGASSAVSKALIPGLEKKEKKIHLEGVTFLRKLACSVIFCNCVSASPEGVIQCSRWY